jgi:hypothetical protein
MVSFAYVRFCWIKILKRSGVCHSGDWPCLQSDGSVCFGALPAVPGRRASCSWYRWNWAIGPILQHAFPWPDTLLRFAFATISLYCCAASVSTRIFTLETERHRGHEWVHEEARQRKLKNGVDAVVGLLAGLVLGQPHGQLLIRRLREVTEWDKLPSFPLQHSCTGLH